MAPPIDLRVVGDRIEELLEHLESSLDGPAFEQVQDVVSLVTELYGGGLARILELSGEDSSLRERMADDELVASLLVLHDLHPLGLEDRVRRALESVRPYLGSHGGDVEVLGIDSEQGVVTLRMLGSCDGCASSSVTLELAVQAAIEEAAPEIVRIDVDAGEDGAAPGATDGGAVSTPVSLGRKPEHAAPAMAPIYGLRALAPGRVGPLEIDGTKVVVCRVGAQLYAYRSECPTCAAALDTASVDGAVLRCSGCGAAYDLPRAGRSLDGNLTHLDPLPLVEEGGEVRIAVTASAGSR
jgi:Fe-S cluster biogenesis protein NfuA/nitrite reductase/ring-hydroxylating ferredoxin subunit